MKFLKILSIFSSLFLTTITYATNLTSFQIAQRSLEANIISLPQGDFLAAGAHQFGSLWTRDFCFSVPGLLAIGKLPLVKNHLTYLIKNRRKDNLVPIYADSINPMIRVILGSANKDLGKKIHLKMSHKIKPYYSASGKFPTIDSNLLLLKVSFEYYQNSKDEKWWQENQKSFKDIYDYYKNFIDKGLIRQGEYSDWQDSSKREGKTFFTNLLYLEISKTFHFLSETEIESLTQKIHETFYDKESGLYFSILGHSYISLDGILWAIEKKLMPNPELLYENLKKHSLWNKYSSPGFATFPSYPKDWIAIQVRLSNLNEYHGNLSWSWLMAYSSIVALKMGDKVEAKRLSKILEDIILRDQVVSEIYYSNETRLPYKSTLYQSEEPFSWGAAFSLIMFKSFN